MFVSSSNACVLADRCAVVSKTESIQATRLKPRQAVSIAASIAKASGPAVFVERMKLQTLLGVENSNLRTVQAALRFYGAFAEQVLLKPEAQLPPTLQELVAFSSVFWNSKTFGNYLSALRLACQIANMPTNAMFGTELRRASANIEKQAEPASPKQFLLCQTISKLSKSARGDGRAMEASLYLLAYCFLLRVRSEALPIVLGSEATLGQRLSVPALLVITDHKVVLRLARRKNRRQETQIVRECVCAKSRSLCSVHMLRKTTHGVMPGDKLFAGLTEARALSMLRCRLHTIGVENSGNYKLHDFRRGHAQDLAIRGNPLSVILRAGDWRSSAFATYLDTVDIEVTCLLSQSITLFTLCFQARAVLATAMEAEGDSDSEVDE